MSLRDRALGFAETPPSPGFHPSGVDPSRYRRDTAASIGVAYSVGFQITANSSSLSDPAARPRLANSLRGPNSGAEIETDT